VPLSCQSSIGFDPQIVAVKLDQTQRPFQPRVRMPQKSGFSATGVP
jgi:hypothetical protein